MSEDEKNTNGTADESQRCCGKKEGHECCGHGKEGDHECCGHGKEEGHECCCGHDHDHECGCGHDGEGHECGCGHDAKTEKANANSDSDFYDAMADYPMPKPSLVTFATTLSQQAMVAMGILPHPLAKKSVFMLNQASYLIDTIELLFEKTAGNRTEGETKTLDNILHDLRMLFVAASNEKKRRDAENKEAEKKDA